MKLALGTVQFGLNYGISNTAGQVSAAEVAKILTTAQANHIDTLDTGCVYGTSEQVLGQCLPHHSPRFKVIDKVPDLETLGKSIEQTLVESLTKLQVPQLEGLLLHNAADLTDDVYTQLCALKSQGLVNNIGISVYHPSQTFDLVQRYPLDLVQLPYNLFDQRFALSGCIHWLHEKNVQIHARSLFLQGLLLMPDNAIPAYFRPFEATFNRLTELCHSHNITRQVAALSMAHQQPEIDRFVIGVCSQVQLEQVIIAYEQARDVKFDSESFSSDEEALISPFLWPQDK